jgi:hypothetical protein
MKKLGLDKPDGAPVTPPEPENAPNPAPAPIKVNVRAVATAVGGVVAVRRVVTSKDITTIVQQQLALRRGAIL